MSTTPNSPFSVLVVDDHPSTATTLARAIAQMDAGIDVISANSGEKALELVQGRIVDLLITDMVMTGMNGLELIEKLQSHPGGRPAHIILITAYDLPGLRETARRLKVNEVIIKPVRPERICQVVAKAMENLGHAQVTQAPDDKPQLKILVADDQPDNVTLLSRCLLNEGYLCISASNGVEALAKIRTDVPDLVLLDVNMPVKDGFETLQEIRSDPAISHIPVIFLTARTEPMDMQSALNMGADDYVTKPFDRRELLARIHTRLRVKEAEDTIRRRNKELNMLPEIGRELSARPNLDELSEIVLRRTVETLGALIGHFILVTPNGPLDRLYLFSGFHNSSEIGPLPLKYLLEKVKESRQGIIINDVHKDPFWETVPGDPTSSILIVPMFGRFDLLGVILLAHEKAGYFSLEHKLLLQAIASQAAIALENAQMHTDASGGQKQIAAILSNPVHAVLIFDREGHLAWLNPAGVELFKGIPLATGKSLGSGPVCDALAGLLKNVQDSGKAESAGVPWLDERVFTALLAPIDDGGTMVLLQNAARLQEQP